MDYPLEIRPLSAEEGGGFLISLTDFSECLSDGEALEEALTNGNDALKASKRDAQNREALTALQIITVALPH